MASSASEFLVAELRQRGERAAAHVLQRNSTAFASLSEADRRRLERLAYAVAARLLDGPASRLERLGRDDANAPTVEAVRELFGLDDSAAGGERLSA
jgi:glutamyl-tRNA reductase